MNNLRTTTATKQPPRVALETRQSAHHKNSHRPISKGYQRSWWLLKSASESADTAWWLFWWLLLSNFSAFGCDSVQAR